jgi:uncharacterized protein YdbL (DUF1318 family)
MTTMTTRIFSLLALFCLSALVAASQDAGALRQRMDQRLPAIDSMKAKQIVGENNRGLLEVRGAASTEQQQLITAENNDRAAVYSLLAKQTGASADDVGRARAKKIAAGSAPGVWLQDESGKWFKK